MNSEVVRLSRMEKAWRLAVLLAVSVLFLLGTFIGWNDWWPFSPWRMFADSTPPSGSVVALVIEVRASDDPAWIHADLSPRSVGLNRAEVEGRISEIVSDPQMLGTLARTHSRLDHDAPPWRSVRVVKDESLLSNGVPTGAHRLTVLAVWPDRIDS